VRACLRQRVPGGVNEHVATGRASPLRFAHPKLRDGFFDARHFVVCGGHHGLSVLAAGSEGVPARCVSEAVGSHVRRAHDAYKPASPVRLG